MQSPGEPRQVQAIPPNLQLTYDIAPMDTAEALLLARAQFGLNIGFHILFPSLTIALAWLLLYFRVRYARSGDPAWLATYRLWTKVFALSFAMGAVSGITMSFQSVT